MTALADAMPVTAADHQHRPWCLIDMLPPGAEPICCTDYTEVELSLGQPIIYEDGEITPDKISLWLEQGGDEAHPRIGFAHGDVIGEEGNRLDCGELTIPEALELVKALTDVIARAVAVEHAPGTPGTQ